MNLLQEKLGGIRSIIYITESKYNNAQDYFTRNKYKEELNKAKEEEIKLVKNIQEEEEMMKKSIEKNNIVSEQIGQRNGKILDRIKSYI